MHSTNHSETQVRKHTHIKSAVWAQLLYFPIDLRCATPQQSCSHHCFTEGLRRSSEGCFTRGDAGRTCSGKPESASRVNMNEKQVSNCLWSSTSFGIQGLVQAHEDKRFASLRSSAAALCCWRQRTRANWMLYLQWRTQSSSLKSEGISFNVLNNSQFQELRSSKLN